MGRLYSNNYSTTISTATVGTGDTSFDLTSVVGLPLVGSGDYCIMTLTDSLTSPTKTEVIKVTAVATNTITVERAQENTTAQTWASGDFAELRATATSFSTLDGTEITRYVETYNGSASTTIDRADGGIQTVTLTASDTYTIVMEDSESMVLEVINTNAYTPAFTGVSWNLGASPTYVGTKTLITLIKINGTIYGAVIGDYS